jgi:putative ABC transport system permease protein
MGVLSDIRYAIRQLRKSPGTTALLVVMLAFAIGGNTAMFVVVDSVMLRPLPYLNADRMVFIGPNTRDFGPVSWMNYRDIREQAQNLESSGAYSLDLGIVSDRNGLANVLAPSVTPSLFQLLGEKPILGRTFLEEEGLASGPHVAVISEALWRDMFSADREIIGKAITINGQARVVVGVMPRGFRFPESAGEDMSRGVWLPLQPSGEMLNKRGLSVLYVVAKGKPGVNTAQLQHELDAIAKRIRQADPEAPSTLAFSATPYKGLLISSVQSIFKALVVALVVVLLIACGNVTSMLSARCIARQQEFAVRTALGAQRGRIIRQLIIEGGILSALGSGVGLALAGLAIAAVHKLPPGTLPRGSDINFRWSVGFILVAIATAITILSSLVPSLLMIRTKAQQALQGARTLGQSRFQNKIGGGLVAGEVALSVLLLVATGLLSRTLWKLQHTQLGFDPSRVTEFTATPADTAGTAGLAVADADHGPTSIAVVTYSPLLERMRQIPGVQEVALMSAPPFSGIDLRTRFRVVGQPKDREHAFLSRLAVVSGRYERAMGTPVIRGRAISEDDVPNAPLVAVINWTSAKKYFGAIDPIGQQIEIGGKTAGLPMPYTIVGIVGDAVDKSVSQPPEPLLLLSYQQFPTTSLLYQPLLKTLACFVVKTEYGVDLPTAMNSVFHEKGANFALDNFQTLQAAVDQSNFAHRIGLYLVSAFAGMAVLMVALGLYGVLSQYVSSRRRELGIRLALGATRRNVLSMILRRGALLVSVGLGIGIILSLSGARLVTSFLFGVTPLDVTSYLIASSLLLVLGNTAALAPAISAARIDPGRTLRDE